MSTILEDAFNFKNLCDNYLRKYDTRIKCEKCNGELCEYSFEKKCDECYELE